jgi:hypothetical protein
MTILDSLAGTNKIEWPWLFIGIGLISLGLGLLYIWNPKRKMKDDPIAANFGILFGGIAFILVGLYSLFLFFKEFF